ncbi:MAG: prepilin-type N-terminal cleavage/methylation domain-containing protein [Candidatus Daviesbacteria bacterium]|nr:prepilin-type N-terminal cleavage/methylation domain-containing protein [Candidatus Daviesbacteria bacterium]
MREKGFSAQARSKGFTLIELLVTISILAVLMTIAIISFQNLQKNARDNKRKSDISTIQSALEQYHADQGYYPTTASITFTSSSTISFGSKVYISKMPLPASGTYSYTASNVTGPSVVSCDNTTTRCINYCLYATLENSSNATTPSLSLCSTAPVSAPASTYQVQAP